MVIAAAGAPRTGEGEVHLGQAVALQPAAPLDEEPPRRCGQAVPVRGPLLQLGHDQPVLRGFSPANDHAGLLALLDAALGAARVQLRPDRGLALLGWNLICGVAGSSLKAGRVLDARPGS